MNKSEAAIRHILQRVVECRDFSWLMLGTQSMGLCLEAEAERRGITREEVEDMIRKGMSRRDEQLRRDDRPTRPEVETLRAEVEQLRMSQSEWIEAARESAEEYYEEHGMQTLRVEELLRDAENGLIELTPERLRAAMNGEHVFL